MTYNWQQENWPDFSYDLAKVEEKLYLFSEKIGAVSGVLKALPEDTQLSAIIDTMVAEAIKTSEIEGEYLSLGSMKQLPEEKHRLSRPLYGRLSLTYILKRSTFSKMVMAGSAGLLPKRQSPRE